MTRTLGQAGCADFTTPVAKRRHLKRWRAFYAAADAGLPTAANLCAVNSWPGPDTPVSCTLCGRPLGFSSDDQPDWPTGPMCGDCYQARELDNDIWAAEMDADLAEDDR